MTDKEQFKKEKLKLLNNGLNTIKGLEDIFNALLEFNWYEDWKYPEEFKKINGSDLESVDFTFLIQKIKNILSV